MFTIGIEMEKRFRRSIVHPYPPSLVMPGVRERKYIFWLKFGLAVAKVVSSTVKLEPRSCKISTYFSLWNCVPISVLQCIYISRSLQKHDAFVMDNLSELELVIISAVHEVETEVHWQLAGRIPDSLGYCQSCKAIFTRQINARSM